MDGVGGKIYCPPGYEYKLGRFFWPSNDKKKGILAGEHIFFVPEIRHVMFCLYEDWCDLVTDYGATVHHSYDDQVTMVISRNRDENYTMCAVHDNKKVGTMWWLSNIIMRGYPVGDKPEQAFLEYPLPSKKIQVEGYCKVHVIKHQFHPLDLTYIEQLIDCTSLKYVTEWIELWDEAPAGDHCVVIRRK